MNKSETLIKEGSINFSSICECDITLRFDPILVVDYAIYKKTDSIIANVLFDFGMSLDINVDSNHNFLTTGYNGLTKKSTPYQILKKTIQFDLFHAFTHYQTDPNYTRYHWALMGWLKDRTKVIQSP